MKIKDIAEIGTGSGNRQDAVENGEYPFYVRSKEIFRNSTYEFDEEAIIIPGEGGIGDIFHYVKGKYALHQRAYRIHFMTEDICTKYAYYYFTAFFKDFIMKKAVNATVTSIRKPMIEDFPIPLPPLSEQERIVGILDKYETMVNDTKQGIPALIDAVQRKYEYYRERLLDLPCPLLQEHPTAQGLWGTPRQEGD